ncbi:MAG: SMI1/KNR4 family protein [Cardiobacteriaceae bacterium]|nr:SMI1/KNR4 family protein [Cardiobacteriaceae bacterium]
MRPLISSPVHSVISAYFPKLNPPADESALLQLEEALGVVLPASFKAWYLNHDGQQLESETLLPGDIRWLPVAEILPAKERWQAFLRTHFGEQWQHIEPQWHDVAIQSALCHERWLPFMEDSDGSWYCLDFAPTEEGGEGQVLYVGLAKSLHQYDVMYESPDFATWLGELLATYQQEDFEPELPALCADYWQQGLERYPESIQEPVSQSAWLALERRLRYSLPDALLTLYRLFDGQSALGVTGSRFLPVEEMGEQQQVLLAGVQSAFGEHWVDAVVDNGAHIQKLPYHPLWLPFYEEEGKALWCYDPVPGADGVIGQVIRLDTQTWHSSLIADDMHEALLGLLKNLLKE